MIIRRKIMDKIDRYIESPEAIVLTGMRRTGKTTVIKYYFENLESENKIYLDLENVVYRKYFDEANYENIKSTFESLGINFKKRAYIFIDEIQFVRNMPSIVKYFIDHYRVKFFLTGSASFYLKNTFSESLSGRKFLFELFPLNFEEFLLFKGKKYQLPQNSYNITEAVFETLSPYFDEYMRYGGFPQVVLKEDADSKNDTLDDIFSSYFQLEVTMFGDFRKNDVIHNLILMLLESVGSKLDIMKISRQLGIARQTLIDYLAFLEGTYLFKTIRPYSKSRSNELRKVPKIYVCDTGLLNRFSKSNEGTIFENSIFQLLRTKGELNYYQRKSGVEIDFILNKKIAYEIKTNPDISDIKRLETVSQDIGIKDFYVVSKKYSPELKNVIYGFMV